MREDRKREKRKEKSETLWTGGEDRRQNGEEERSGRAEWRRWERMGGGTSCTEQAGGEGRKGITWNEKGVTE